MLTLASLFLTFSLFANFVLTNPISSDLSRRQIQSPDDVILTTSSQGIHDGYYYSWWTDGVHKATYTNLPGGAYSVTWQPGKAAGGNFIGGKGWKGGGNRTIKYSGTFNVDKNGYLAIYGYSPTPFTEWYVLDYWGTYNPAQSATKMGDVNCDGGQYEIYRQISYLMTPPGVSGLQTRVYSIRKEKRIGGTVTTGCHFDAWEKLNIKLGEYQYQIVAVEGYSSAGNATILVETPP
ncbi:endo-1,4-beta-xylanase I precursor [Cladorrhinum sp. PSN259]|nr:endo-1,4-beta-xylanase I precursor [Cladorrhinum sp. PSN259]